MDTDALEIGAGGDVAMRIRSRETMTYGRLEGLGAGVIPSGYDSACEDM